MLQIVDQLRSRLFADNMIASRMFNITGMTRALQLRALSRRALA